MGELSFDDALALLGVDLDADTREVRRAYLRLLKSHKPERDPEGFMRLRQAYELVSHQISWRRSVAHYEEEQEDEDQLEVAIEEDEQPLPVPLEAPPEPEEPEELDLGPWWERFYELPDEASPETLLAVVAEAVAAHPEHPDVHWFELHVLDQVEAPQEPRHAARVAAALRAGHEKGGAGFLEQLLRRAPEELGPDELEQLASSPEPTMRTALARAFLVRGESARGVAMVRQLLSELESLDEEHDPRWWGVFELILQSYEAELREPATELATEFSRVLETTGAELRFARRAGYKLLLFQELVAIAPDLSAPLAGGFARAVRAYDASDDCMPALESLWKDGRDPLRGSSNQLTGRAPNLMQLHYEAGVRVAGQAGQPERPGQEADPWWKGPLSLLLVGALAPAMVLVYKARYCSSEDRPPVVLERAPPELPELAPTPELRLAAKHVEALCLWRHDPSPFCRQIRDLASRLRVADCPTLTGVVPEFEELLSSWPEKLPPRDTVEGFPGTCKALLEEVRQAISAHCRGAAPDAGATMDGGAGGG